MLSSPSAGTPSKGRRMVSLPTAESSPAAGTQSKAGRRTPQPLSPTAESLPTPANKRKSAPSSASMTMFSAGTGKKAAKKSKVQVKMEAINKRPPNVTSEEDMLISRSFVHVSENPNVVKKTLSSSYYIEMDSFLLSFKKETADARSKGNVDEKSANPISYSLFHLILIWAIDQGYIFLWVWTILQWNLMARSISVDPLALHNFSVSEDHFAIQHNLTKANKEDERHTTRLCTAIRSIPLYVLGSVWTFGYCWSRIPSKIQRRYFLLGGKRRISCPPVVL
jgi:hypothetical protein